MDQLLCASLSHTHYLYEVGMLKVPAMYQVCMYDHHIIISRISMDKPGKIVNPSRGQLNRENKYFPVHVRAREFGLARRVRPSRPAPACSLYTLRLNLMLSHGIHPDFRGGVHFFIPPYTIGSVPSLSSHVRWLAAGTIPNSLLFWQVLCVIVPFVLFFVFVLLSYLLFCFVLMLSLELCRCSPDFSFPADHVPDWHPRILLGMVEARSVDVNNTTQQLHTDSVHCRESAGTWPVVLKVVPVTGAAFAGHHGPIIVRLSFFTPTILLLV